MHEKDVRLFMSGDAGNMVSMCRSRNPLNFSDFVRFPLCLRRPVAGKPRGSKPWVKKNS